MLPHNIKTMLSSDTMGSHIKNPMLGMSYFFSNFGQWDPIDHRPKHNRQLPTFLFTYQSYTSPIFFTDRDP